MAWGLNSDADGPGFSLTLGRGWDASWLPASWEQEFVFSSLGLLGQLLPLHGARLILCLASDKSRNSYPECQAPSFSHGSTTVCRTCVLWLELGFWGRLLSARCRESSLPGGSGWLLGTAVKAWPGEFFFLSVASSPTFYPLLACFFVWVMEEMLLGSSRVSFRWEWASGLSLDSVASTKT